MRRAILRTVWTIGMTAALSASVVLATEPELPPILIPPASDESAAPLFVPELPPPETRTRKVTPLEVSPVPETAPDLGLTIPRSTIPATPYPESPSPLPDYPSTIPATPFPSPNGSLSPSLGAAPGFGLHVVVGEDFANRFASTQRTDQGPFSDCVLGAKIQGCQTTDAQTRINFQFCDRLALGQLELFGKTKSQARATTSQAAIDTTGDAQFLVTKALEFNGEVVATRSPAAFLVSAQQVRGAQTSFSGVPLIGPLASAYAASEANRRRPESERIAAYKITEQVVPQFNTAVDEQLTGLNVRLADLQTQLRSLSAVPMAIQARSSEQAMILSVKLTPEEQSAPPIVLGEQGLSVAVHETLVQGILGRFPLAGMQIPDTQLQEFGKQIAARLGGGATNTNVAPRQAMATLILAAQNPVTVRFQNGRIEIVVVTALQAMGGPRLGERAITIPVRAQLDATTVRIFPEAVDVRTLVAGEAAVDEVANRLIRQAIEEQFRPFDVPRQFTIPLDGGRTLPISVTGVEVRNGWVDVRLAAEGEFQPVGVPQPEALPPGFSPTFGPSSAPMLEGPAYEAQPIPPQTMTPNFNPQGGSGTLTERFRVRSPRRLGQKW